MASFRTFLEAITDSFDQLFWPYFLRNTKPLTIFDEGYCDILFPCPENVSGCHFIFRLTPLVEFQSTNEKTFFSMKASRRAEKNKPKKILHAVHFS